MTRKLWWLLGLIVGIFLLALLVLTFKHSVWPWIEVHTGTVNEPGPYYGFWSGFGSDIGEVTLIAAILGPAAVVYHHHQCVECKRLSRHKTDDTAQRFCHHHWTREHVDKHRELHKLRFPCHLAHEPPTPSVPQFTVTMAPTTPPAKTAQKTATSAKKAAKVAKPAAKSAKGAK